jgi:hypothetical protein
MIPSGFHTHTHTNIHRTPRTYIHQLVCHPHSARARKYVASLPVLWAPTRTSRQIECQIFVSDRTSEYIYVYMYIYIYTHTYIHTYIFIYTYIYIYIHMYNIHSFVGDFPLLTPGGWWVIVGANGLNPCRQLHQPVFMCWTPSHKPLFLYAF